MTCYIDLAPTYTVHLKLRLSNNTNIGSAILVQDFNNEEAKTLLIDEIGTFCFTIIRGCKVGAPKYVD